MATIVFGSGFRDRRPGPSGKFWVLLVPDLDSTSSEPLYHCWAPTREALVRLAAARRWEYYDILEMDAEPAVAPAESPREICTTKLTRLTSYRRYRRRRIYDGRDFRGELVDRYATMGELADAGERALLDLEFPADVIDQVDDQLARLGLELAAAEDEEAEAA
jgi:hypothetical protein